MPMTFSSSGNMSLNPQQIGSFRAGVPLYVGTLLIVTVVTVLTQAIPAIAERAVFLMYFFAVMQTSFWLGRQAGIVATILSLIAVNVFILETSWHSETLVTFIVNTFFCTLALVIVSTIAHRQALMQTLLLNRQDLAQAQAIGQIGSWRLNVKKNELTWSDENHRIFGVPKNTPLTYEAFLLSVHPDDRDYVNAEWKAALRGEPYDIEHRLLISGVIKWVRETASLEFNNKGELLGGFGITQDITEHKLREQELEDSKQRYQKILESAMDAVITVDDEQCIEVFNKAAEIMFGLSAQEVLGTKLTRLIPDRFHQNHQKHFDAFKTNGLTARKMGDLSVLSGLRANGEEFPIEASISQVNLSGKQSYTVILRDITERQRGESALKKQLELQNQLTKLAATVPGVICSFRLRKDGTACMPYANERFESIYGISHAQVMDDFSPVFNRIHPDDIDYINQTVAESARTMKPWWETFRYFHPLKGEIWLEGHSMPKAEADGSIIWQGYVHDITERKVNETQIRDQESQLRLIMNAMPALVSYIDTDFRYVRINKTYENWFSISQEQIVGQYVKDIVGPNAWLVVCPNLEKARSGQLVNFDSQIAYGNGKPRWVSASYIPDKDADGKVKGIVIHVLDIDDRKHSEQVIQENEEFVRGVLNSLPEHVVVLDQQGNVTAVNESWERFAENNNGEPSKVSVGVNYLEVCRKSSREGDHYAQKALEGLENLLACREGDFMLEYPCETPTQHLWFLMNAKRVQNRYAAIIVTHLDITERRQAQEKLLNAQARLTLVFEEVNAGYWDWNLNTRELYLSPECKCQIGFESDELPSHWELWISRLHPDDQAAFLKAIESYINGVHSNFEMQFRLQHKDGSYRWLHSRAALIYDQYNRPSRLLGINLDITDFRKVQELHKRREELEQSFRYYVASQTVAAIAHELNQPLTAIASYADVALHILDGGNKSPKKLRYALENCSKQADRAGQVIRELFHLLHKGETTTEKIDINQLVAELVEFMRSNGDLAGYVVNLELTNNLSRVLVNSLQIQKVLINLIRNSLDSMRETGLTTGSMIISTNQYSENPGFAKITVQDRGKGVSDNSALKTIFQPFYTSKVDGLGMGLSISRTLVEAHGGKMWAEQNINGGLSVHFTLPYAP